MLYVQLNKKKREAGGQGEFSVGRVFGAATPRRAAGFLTQPRPPGALVHVKIVTVLNVFAPHALACRRKVKRDLKIFSDLPHCRASGALKI